MICYKGCSLYFHLFRGAELGSHMACPKKGKRILDWGGILHIEVLGERRRRRVDPGSTEFHMLVLLP